MRDHDAGKEAKKIAFKKWYETNKENLNLQRKYRYMNDEEFRERMIANATKYQNRKTLDSKKRTIQGEKGTIELKILRLGEVSKITGVSESSIRHYEKKGYIPKPIFDEHQRCYTEYQCKIIKELANIIRLKGYLIPNKSERLKTQIEYISAHWRDDIALSTSD
ncbi:MAG: hypothetical protein A2Y07_10800 [Planctomycetes bacterium GWF2_50_10]|nr:MAG: hypothetical protein A2Y07_10800 [Planctomycetes bacterium GWF2_50_10]